MKYRMEKFGGKIVEQDAFGAVRGEISYKTWKRWWHQWLKHKGDANRAEITKNDLADLEKVEMREWLEWIKDKSFVSEEIAYEFVRNHQPSKDPSDPEGPLFAKDLHALVAEGLDIDDYSRLRFYTAVGSHVDYFLGVDGFFELDLEDGTTLTLTLNVKSFEDSDSKPTSAEKADLLVYYPSEGFDLSVDEHRIHRNKEDKHRFDETVQRAVDDIVSSFQADIKRHLSSHRKEMAA